VTTSARARDFGALSGRLAPHAFDIACGACSLGFLIWVLLWQYSQYAAGMFGYHDLTIINDFFSNALVHGKPFWVTNAGLSHLSIHFTPSLLLLVPAFVPFHGQFALIALAATSVCCGIFIATRAQFASLGRTEIPSGWRWALSAAFFVAFAGNRYTLRILSSAHFEPFFVLTAALVLSAVGRDARYRTLLPLLLVAVGVRQDAGFFLFFALCSCVFAPRAFGGVSRTKLAVSAGLCIVYVLFAAKIAMRWFGNDGGTRFWHQWGNTWSQVMMAWARSPEKVWAAVEASDFFSFNAELSWLQALNPLAWFTNQLPGILFYTADTADKQHLEFYNASFLLPGLMLCFGFAQLHAVSLLQRFAREHRRWQQLGLTIILGIFSYAAIEAALRTPRGESETLRVTDLTRRDPFVNSPLRDLLRCRAIHSVAADFRNIVYAPLRRDKFLLQRAREADVVVVPTHDDKGLPFFIKHKRVVQDLQRDGKYELYASMEGYEIYLDSHVACHPKP
jgi:hypothetical protein